MFGLLKEWQREMAGVWQTLRPFSLYFPVKKFNSKARTAIVLFIFLQTKSFFGVTLSCLNFSYPILVLLNVQRHVVGTLYSDVNIINMLSFGPKLEEMTSVGSSCPAPRDAGGFSQVISSKFRLVHFLKALKFICFLLPLADDYAAVLE